MAYRRRYNTRHPLVKRRVRRAIKKVVNRKRYYKRVPRNVTTMANIPRIQKLRYVDTITLSATSGAIASHLFRANSLYDPDYTATGHQPMRFDQMAAFYADYVVVGAKITAKYIGNINTSNIAPMNFVIYLDDDTTGPALLRSEMEDGKCKYKIISQDAGSKCSLTKTFSAKKFFNITNIKDNLARIGATCSNNPSDQAYFVLSLQAADLSSTVSGTFLVTIEYIAIFSQPIDVAAS